MLSIKSVAPPPAQLVEKFVARYLTADRVRHRKPAARDDPAVAQDDDAAFRLDTARDLLQDRGFARAGRAHEMHHAVLFERSIQTPSINSVRASLTPPT